MTHFPDPVTVPDDVLKARKDRLDHLIKSTALGIAIRSSIIFAEIAGYSYFASNSLLMDALASLVDIVSSVLLIVFVWYAARPPDENHPFGHGRVEPLIGLQLGIFLAVLGGGMFVQQLFEFSSVPNHADISPYAFIIPMCAVIFLEICYCVMTRVAKMQNSPALYAEAAHYRVDSVSSIFATIALLSGTFLPGWSGVLDHVGAVSIALLMVILGISASRLNLNQLIDQVPDQRFFDLVKKAALKVPGVRDTEKIKILEYGPNAHVDIDVEVDPSLNVVEAHKISQNVRVEVQKAWASVQDVVVHIEPYYPGDH